MAREERLDRGRQLALHADRGALEVLVLGDLVGLADEHVDRRAAIDAHPDEAGAVRSRELGEFGEGTGGRELRLVARDERVVRSRERGLQIDLQAHLVEVALVLGHDDLDDGCRSSEVEPGQVGDGAGILVRLTALAADTGLADASGLGCRGGFGGRRRRGIGGRGGGRGRLAAAPCRAERDRNSEDDRHRALMSHGKPP